MSPLQVQKNYVIIYLKTYQNNVTTKVPKNIETGEDSQRFYKTRDSCIHANCQPINLLFFDFMAARKLHIC